MRDSNDWYILGIDNGFGGYACLLNVGTGSYRFIPTPIKKGLITLPELRIEDELDSPEYDFVSMSKIAAAAAKVSGGACVAVIEETISTHSQGSQANATSARSRDSLLRGKSLWGAACELAGIQSFAVSPSRWKAGMSLINTAKSASVELAEQMGVVIPRSAGPKSKLSPDAAESFLIAKWFSVNGVVSQWL